MDQAVNPNMAGNFLRRRSIRPAHLKQDPNEVGKYAPGHLPDFGRAFFTSENIGQIIQRHLPMPALQYEPRVSKPSAKHCRLMAWNQPDNPKCHGYDMV